MNTEFQLPQLIYALRLNVSHMSRFLLLLLICNFCLILAGIGFVAFLYMPSGFAQWFSAAMLGAACIPALLCIETLRQMGQVDLVLPVE